MTKKRITTQPPLLKGEWKYEGQLHLFQYGVIIMIAHLPIKRDCLLAQVAVMDKYFRFEPVPFKYFFKLISCSPVLAIIRIGRPEL